MGEISKCHSGTTAIEQIAKQKGYKLVDDYQYAEKRLANSAVRCCG